MVQLKTPHPTGVLTLTRGARQESTGTNPDKVVVHCSSDTLRASEMYHTIRFLFFLTVNLPTPLTCVACRN